MISGISEKNRRILDELNRLRKGPFSIAEAATTLGIPLEEARILLAYFVRKGWLARVRRGLYITVPLGTVNPQEYKENPWIVTERVFSPCYIGGWSAAEHWEFTEQIFNSIVVFTLKKFRTKNMRIQGTDYVLKFVKEKYFGKTKSVWIENIKVQVSDPVQTIVDILDDPFIGAGMRNIRDIVEKYFQSEHRDDMLLISYIKARGNRTVNKRLGYLIETLDIKALRLLEYCAKNISSGFSLLDPSVEPKGSFNRKWNLRINVNVE
jgi:predicted transcriptional regulator of viral defense system